MTHINQSTFYDSGKITDTWSAILTSHTVHQQQTTLVSFIILEYALWQQNTIHLPNKSSHPTTDSDDNFVLVNHFSKL